MRRLDPVACLVGACLFVVSLMATAQSTGGKVVQSGYAPVNGLKMYYEIHGEGEPLVLVHGGVVGITMFGGNVEALAKGRKVIAVELQAHAHTADIDRPLSFEAMADDVAALVKYLGLQRVDLMGYSLGGGVVQQVAIRHPDVVRNNKTQQAQEVQKKSTEGDDAPIAESTKPPLHACRILQQGRPARCRPRKTTMDCGIALRGI